MAFDSRNPVHMDELNIELTTDPQLLGYAPFVASNAHGTLSFMLTDLLTYSASVEVAFITGDEAKCAADGVEMGELTTNQLLMWLIFTTSGNIEVRHPNIKAQIQEIWKGKATTIANLQALQTKLGTRAEELWGDGSVVTGEEVAVALDPSLAGQVRA